MGAPASFLRLHPRLIASAIVGVAAYLFLRPGHAPLSSFLVAWNVACWSWIALIAQMMSSRTPASQRELTGEEDVGAWVVLVFVCVAAGVSVVAIVMELAGTPGGARSYTNLTYALAGATVSGSWLAVGLAFASHYAHLYFTCRPGERPLRFPEDIESPGYWDFLYFAFTISVAAQTSDVSVIGTPMRRLVVVHSVLGFAFNAAIIGFSINMFAGALAK